MNHPQELGIAERFGQAVAAFGDELAIIDGDRRITYRELRHHVNRTRNWFAQRPRLRPGSLVAISLRNSWQFVASFFAAVESGYTLVLCNTAWRAAELQRLTEHLPIDAVITSDELSPEWNAIAGAFPEGSILNWDSILNSAGALDLPMPAQARLIRTQEGPLGYLLTSGSTGVPKVVPRSNRNLTFGATYLGDALQITPGSRWMSVIPFYHSWGFHAGLFVPLLRGATSVILRQFHAWQCAALIRAERVNAMIASPFVYRFLADAIAEPSDLASLQRCYWSGSRMNTAVEKAWQERFDIRLRPWYGMSEANAISIDLATEGPANPAEGFVGAPFPGVEVRIFGPEGQPLGANETGEIAVRSHGVMSGYVNESERNRDFFYDDFFRTGDLGRVDERGNLYLSGRARLVINIGGLKVDPVEIERIVETLDPVAGCRVDSVAGGVAGESIRARVVLRRGFQISRREIVEHCRRQLAEYKIPRIIEISDNSETSATGKMTR